MMPKVKRLASSDTELLKACAELSKQALPGEAWSFQSFLSETQKSGGCVLAVMDDENHLLGFLTGASVMDTADLTAIAVSSQCRNQGIGMMLMQEFMKLCSGMTIFLEVRASNAPAVALYQKCGFHQAGIRKRFYQHPDEDAVLMQKEG